ncbi:hypothetical protein GO608_016765 [Aromatoleum buckelii]|nr:hypothetical protein [Aromatoleum buckelii]
MTPDERETVSAFTTRFATYQEQIGKTMRSIAIEEESATTPFGGITISRRMVSYYRTAHKAIPRAIWLACLGWEATRPNTKTLPRALPTRVVRGRMGVA